MRLLYYKVKTDQGEESHNHIAEGNTILSCKSIGLIKRYMATKHSTDENNVVIANVMILED
jgi:hypothetical protein